MISTDLPFAEFLNNWDSAKKGYILNLVTHALTLVFDQQHH